jgi:hypothetical protein
VDPLLLAVVVALAVPLVTRGSYRRLVDTRWRWVPVLLGGLAIQIFLDTGALPRRLWHGLGFALLVVSLAMIIAFCARNLIVRGMAVVLVGVCANTLAIVVNHGMPVDVPKEWVADGTYQPSVKHHLQRPSDRLVFLSDIIVIRWGVGNVLSFGDLIIAVGLIDVTYRASRVPARRSRRR